jgi:hypothetical protein
VSVALKRAFFSERNFQELIDAVDAEVASGAADTRLIERWVAAHRERLLVQTATRRLNNPNSNGPVEELLRSLSRRIQDRAGRFTNRHRLRKLLLLMTMEAARHADTRAWTRFIQDALHERAGRPAKQRPMTTATARCRRSPAQPAPPEAGRADDAAPPAHAAAAAWSSPTPKTGRARSATGVAWSQGGRVNVRPRR